MMLLEISQFGGIVPRVLDPILLAPNKSQIAQNCQFDSGDLEPLYEDLYIVPSVISP